MLAQIQKVTMEYAGVTVLDNISVNIDKGDKIGLIGPNGAGKTTLLKIMTNRLTPTDGSVSYASGLTLGYLTQNLGLRDELTVYEEAKTAFSSVLELEKEINRIADAINKAENEEQALRLSERLVKLTEEFEAKRGYYYESIITSTLKGLGFNESDFDKKTQYLSGGQKMRVALSKILIAEPELLLLDEPTNYLDMKSMDWLTTYLTNYPGSYIVVSHDRYFLSRSTNRIWEISENSLNSYRGNYESYLVQRDDEAYAKQRAYKKQSDYIKKQKAIIEKLKSYNREKSIRRAESREKLLSHIDVIDKPKEESVSRIRFENKKVISRYALKFHELSVGYNGNAIVGVLDMLVLTGEKIGIIGDNAAGKSTLIKTINREIPPVSGYIEYGAGSVLNHFSQTHGEVDRDKTLLEELAQYSGKDNLAVRNVLASLLFTGEDVVKPIGVLSGGELARVAVARLMLTNANILLLDEPTNHLDIPSKEVFEQALSDFDGTIFVISHDRYLLNKIADRIIYIDNGRFSVYDGNYDSFAETVFGTRSPEKPAQESTAEPKENLFPKADKTLTEKNVKLSKNELFRAEKRLEELNELISRLESEISEAEDDISSPEFYEDSLAASEFLEEYERKKLTYDSLENEWLELTEKLEQNRE